MKAAWWLTTRHFFTHSAGITVCCFTHQTPLGRGAWETVTDGPRGACSLARDQEPQSGN